MRKTIVMLAVITVIVMGIISIILQGAVYENMSDKTQNLTPKYKTTIYMSGNYLNPNITIGDFPPSTSKLNWKSSRYVYEIKTLYPLKLENIKTIIEEFFREKPKIILEITAKDEIYNFTVKDEEGTLYSKTIAKEGKILNETFRRKPHSDEKFKMFRLPQDGPSLHPYRDWMLFLDENFSWKLEMINDIKYDNNDRTGQYVFRKTETIYYVDGIERIGKRECFKVIISQYQELEPIQPKNKEGHEYSLPQLEYRSPAKISSAHHSIMWIDKNERILVRTIDYYPSFLSYEQTVK